jgi:hypothetical protein
MTEEELRERGILRGEDGIAAEAAEVARSVLRELPVGCLARPEREFTEDEVAALLEGGMDVKRPVRCDGRLASAAAKHAGMMASALTVHPNPDLCLEEEEQEPVSPRGWLLSGGSPEAVVPLAREI